MKWMGKSVISDVDNTLVEYSRVNYHIIIYTMFQIFKFFFFFFKFLFLFRGEGGTETSVCGCLSHAPATGDPARNPGMGPNWDLNQWPFASQASTQSIEPHQPGTDIQILND